LTNGLVSASFAVCSISSVGMLRRLSETSLLASLDILDLLFWRLRWHTYEVWTTVLTLRVLDQYRPVVGIANGYTSVDGYNKVVDFSEIHECGPRRDRQHSRMISEVPSRSGLSEGKIWQLRMGSICFGWRSRV
jgi:hypothetical protein